MDITINTPALLFPAISLVMLAYGNRFVAIAGVIRNLHEKYKVNENKSDPVLHAQINNLRKRLNLIRKMQALGVTSFLLAIISMYLISVDEVRWANYIFGTAIVFFATSLVISLIEIYMSTRSLELELSDMEGLEDSDIVDYLKNKIKGE